MSAAGRWESWVGAGALLAAAALVWNGWRTASRVELREAVLREYHADPASPERALRVIEAAPRRLRSDPVVQLAEAAARLAGARQAEPERRRAAAERALELCASAARATEPSLRAAARCGEAIASLMLRSTLPAEQQEDRSGGVTQLALRVARSERALPRSVAAARAAFELWRGEPETALETLAQAQALAEQPPRGTLLTEALVRCHAHARTGRLFAAAQALAPALLLAPRLPGIAERRLQLLVAALEGAADGAELSQRVAATEAELEPVYPRGRARRASPALVRDPLQQARLWTAVGRARLRLGEREAALIALQRAYALATREAAREPDDPAVAPIALALGEAYLVAAGATEDEAQRADQAVRAARKLALAGKVLAEGGRAHAGRVLVDAAVAYALAGYGEQALRALERAVSAGAQQDGRWWRTRAVAIDLGPASTEEVIAAYREAIEHTGSGEDAAGWRERLAELEARRRR